MPGSESNPEMQSVQIVLRGDFNPKIFQPAWMHAQGLVGKTEAEEAAVEIISPQATVLGFKRARLQVTQDRFIASTDDPTHFLSVSDLVRGLLELLDGTPIRALGLNRQMHFPTGSEERWHALGHLLAPKQPWESVFSHREGELPGLINVTMQGNRSDAEAEYIRVRLEPSTQTKFGVLIATNEHYVFDVEHPTAAVVDRIEEGWSDALDFALESAKKLLALVPPEAS